MNIAGFMLVSLFSSVAFADSIPLQSCETPNTFDELVEWMKAVDTQKLVNKNDPLEKGDYQSQLGFVIRKSCLASNRNSVILEVEEAMAYMLQQTSRCYKLVGFPSLVSIPALARTLEFTCSIGSPGASAVVIADQSWIPKEHFFRKTQLSANTTGRRRVDLHKSADGKIQSPSTNAKSTVELGAILLHEILHLTSSNNRSWHNEPSKDSDRNCAHSLWKDRIYFIHSVCTPPSFYGRMFWKGGGFYPPDESKAIPPLIACKDLCSEALGEPDPWKDTPSSRSFYKGDKLFWAKAFPKPEKDILCGRVEDLAERYNRIVRTQRDLSLRYNPEQISEFPIRKALEGGDPHLRLRFDRFQEILENPIPFKEKQKELAGLYTEIKNKLVQFCASQPYRCSPSDERYQFYLKQGMDFFQSLNQEGEDFLRFAFENR